jgi:hypothetical protein
MIGCDIVIGLIISWSLPLAVWVSQWRKKQRVGQRILVMRWCPLHHVIHFSG